MDRRDALPEPKENEPECIDLYLPLVMKIGETTVLFCAGKVEFLAQPAE